MITSYETKWLETDRLILAKGQVEDYLQVYEYDFRKLRNIDGEFVLKKQDLNEIRNWFPKRMEEKYKENEESHCFDWIIYLKETKKPIGNITADREEESINSIELAFNLHPDHWGKGYMTEAVSKVMDYLFEIGYDNVILGYSEGNINSKRVAEKMGFELYKIKENKWMKNGKYITEYEMIMSKEKWLNKDRTR